MFRFDSMEEAVERTAVLQELCYAVRIVGSDAGATSGAPANTAGEIPFGAQVRTRIGRNKREVARVPIDVGGETYALEMVQPFHTVISNVTAKSSAPGGHAHILAAIGELLYRDTLTGVYNRSFLDEALAAAIDQARARRKPLSVLLLRIDCTMTSGEPCWPVAGDLALQHTAQLLQKRLPSARCFVARYGGNEFVVCLPDLDLAAAARAANRLRLAVAGERILLERSEVGIVCRFGIGAMCGDEKETTAEQLIARAREQLDAEKRESRRVFG